MKSSFKAIITLASPIYFSSLAFASTNSDLIALSDLIRSQTPHYQPECHIKETPKDIPWQCRYLLVDIDQNRAKEEKTQIFGLEIPSNKFLITNLRNRQPRGIYLLDSFDKDYVINNFVADLSHSKRMQRSMSPENKVMEFVIHRRFNIERNGEGSVTLKYRVRYFSASPFYARSGDRDKYVEISLSEGSGVDIGLDKYNSDIFYRWSKGSKTNYVYREYIDSASISLQVKDKEKLQFGEVYLNDFSPKMQDQLESKIEKDTSKTIKLGLSVVPKLPISSAEYTLSTRYSITNKKQFELATQVNDEGYKIEYRNSQYGSHLDRESGFCNLGSADGWCWDYVEVHEKMDPWDFDKLRENNSLAIRGLRPDFNAKIAAKHNVTGTTEIAVKTQINALALFGHDRWIYGNRFATGNQLKHTSVFFPAWKTEQDYENLTYIDSFTLNVNWDSPWFLGADSVNIKSTFLSQEKAYCLTVNDGAHLAFTPCIDGSLSQSFVYDNERRYRSVVDLTRCLDSANGNLSLSLNCQDDYAPNTQVWHWKDPYGIANDMLFTVNSDGSINALQASSYQPEISTISGTQNATQNTLFTSRLSDFSLVKP